MSLLINVFLRSLYSLIFALTIPVLLLRLWWKGRKNPGYRERWAERFGVFKPPTKTGGLWLHAVSVGETMAAVPLIREYQRRFPEQPITLTSTTPTGYKIAQTLFKGEIFQVYFPYDLTWCFKRFLNSIRPAMLVVIEKELWLNCFRMCYQRHIPVYIANGSLSEHSLKRYEFFQPMTQLMLECITRVFAQSKTDADRFLALGLDARRLTMNGNMKFDVTLKTEFSTAGKQFRETFGKRPVWVAASTHAGEEEQVLVACQEVLQYHPETLLILVPRHPERFESIASLLTQQAYTFVKRSSGLPITSDTQILLGDTMGELMLLYAASDLTFVGGSLVPGVGGHNTLEPAALGIPILVGPYVNNYVDITTLLLEAGALVQVNDGQALAKTVVEWLTAPQKLQKAGNIAKSVVEHNKGAVKQIVDVIFE